MNRNKFPKTSATKPAAKKEVANRTIYTLEEIAKFPVLATTTSNWRQRNITLYQHPIHADSVISVGITFDGTLTVVAEELKDQWATALDYAKHGKHYVSQ
jgi:hypothetical protein